MCHHGAPVVPESPPPPRAQMKPHSSQSSPPNKLVPELIVPQQKGTVVQHRVVVGENLHPHVQGRARRGIVVFKPTPPKHT